MSKFPKGKKGMRRKLDREKLTAQLNVAQAMQEASKALDEQAEELRAYRRLLISERAQVIYYSDKYVACLMQQCLDLTAQNFLDLEESLQEPYVKRAIVELSDAQGIVPHDKSAEQVQKQAATVAKKIILPN
jgi:hypothetical protein